MSVTVVEHVRLFDGVNEAVEANAAIVVEDDRIRDAGADAQFRGEATRINGRGLFAMPGLIDAHYHAFSPSYDFYGTDRLHPSLLANHAARLLSGALNRGFTSVRDAGGGDVGLAQALAAGLIDGPRFYYPGKAHTPTGGHGDMRR